MTAPGEAGSGCRALEVLAAQHGAVVPPTVTVRTPSSGSHLYFRMPEGVELRNSQQLLAPRVDTRGHGGYVLAAGSVLPSGRYTPVSGAGGKIAELPAWLVPLLQPPRVETVVGVDAAMSLPAGRAKAYLEAIIESETAAVALAEVGSRHSTRLRAARALGRLVGGGELDLRTARSVLLEAAAAHRGVDTAAREIERDIDDGLAYGARLPRRIRRDL